MTNLFISYSKRDYQWFLKFKDAFRNETAHGFVQLWSDGDIRPGASFVDAISAAIAQCDVIVILLSSDYLSSEYCIKVEIPNVLKQSKSRHVQLFPLLVSSVPLDRLPTEIKMIKMNDIPLKMMNDIQFLEQVTILKTAVKRYTGIQNTSVNTSFNFPTSGNAFSDAFNIASGVTGGYNDINLSGAANIFTQAELENEAEVKNDDEN
jgi:hypothetical protein